MKKILDFLDNIEDKLLYILLPFMCVVIFIATFCRFTKIIALPWSEELARYCMVWIIFLGIGSAAKTGGHFCVEAITMVLPKTFRNILSVIRVVIVGAFNLFVSFYAMKIVQNQIMMQQVTPSLKWPMWMIYAAIPIGCILMTIRYGWFTYKEMVGNRKNNNGGDI